MFAHLPSQYFCLSSLGCGIGYGYLHRIPTLPFLEGTGVSFPAQTPIEPVTSPKDGFTEVHLSAVIPTVPVAVSSSASTGLAQSLAGVSSTLTTFVSNLQTGLPPLSLPGVTRPPLDLLLPTTAAKASPATTLHTRTTSPSSTIQMNSSLTRTPIPSPVATSESINITMTADSS
ncbi:Golgi reassembly-stacking protein 2 [Liparis tanakae]|uniref:Golgi reassembly-stacking protein 2 n=1 Tax=Liparis tanakae TaxID=230148 RepID=A0A4Z2FTD5_9TELE|nr:Golgi reassembly-stacking protein 2 [Liparis tanakae]